MEKQFYTELSDILLWNHIGEGIKIDDFFFSNQIIIVFLHHEDFLIIIKIYLFYKIVCAVKISIYLYYK